MDCKAALQEILNAGAELTPEVRRHVSECRECRILAEEWQTLQNVKPAHDEFSPPEEIDVVVMREAETFIQHRRNRPKMLNQWLYLVSAAACVMLVAWICLAMLKTNPGGTAKIQVENADNNVPANIFKGEKRQDILSWQKLDLEDDCVDLAIDIEVIMANLNIGPDKPKKESQEAKFQIEIPDIIT